MVKSKDISNTELLEFIQENGVTKVEFGVLNAEFKNMQGEIKNIQAKLHSHTVILNTLAQDMKILKTEKMAQISAH